MNSALINALAGALSDYRQAIARTSDPEAKEDYLTLAAITDKILAAMQSGDTAQVKLGLLGFSHQVSDAYSTQPPEYRMLSDKIAEIKKSIG